MDSTLTGELHHPVLGLLSHTGFIRAWRDPRGLSPGHVLTAQALGNVCPVGLEKPTEMAWDGKEEEQALWLGSGYWGPSQSLAAASTRVGHDHSKFQKVSAGLHGYGMLGPQPMDSICLKSQDP